jgi:hypothetical protein
MKKYFFYSRNDGNREPISYTTSESRLGAAKKFATIKNLSLKSFLSIYTVSDDPR